ncbi:TniQ family protein [Lysobacter sp.]|uniref:TniQ family protein n=1 Tax=Lysobacter sp. TaxID=72226 RepID=UPI002D4A8BBB|nr:TniQ family protein [Lysobacter sp.]HZX77384.1 TniQ family protein [Lysobacter sp.]
MLVLTPAPHPTECISGYLHTLSTANGYDRPTRVICHLRRVGKLVHLRLADIDVIRDIAGVDKRTAERLCFRPEDPKSKKTMRLLGQEVYVDEARMDVFRICPACVRETGRHEAAWHLKVMDWCPIHRIRLLEQCEACDRPLGWNRPAVGRCSCGSDLTAQGRASTCSDTLARLLQAFRAVLYRNAAAPMPEALAHLKDLDLYALSRLVHVLCDQFWERDKRGIPLGPRRTAEHLEAVSVMLDDWPHNFRSFLVERYEEAILADRWGDAFRSQLYWALTCLKKNMRKRRVQYEFLIDEVYHFGARYIPRERLVRGEKIRQPVASQWGSILEAASVAGMDPRTLARRIRAGDDIPILRADVHRANRYVLVDMDWARSWKVSRYAPVNVRHAAELLGVSVNVLEGLRKQGVFRTNHHTNRANGYSEEDIEAFSRVLQYLVERHSNDGTVGGLMADGVTLRTTKSVQLRIALLGGLIAKYPDIWGAATAVPDAESVDGQIAIETTCGGWGWRVEADAQLAGSALLASA